MGQKEEELKAAKDLAVKAEAELKDISQKHSQVRGQASPLGRSKVVPRTLNPPPPHPP